MNETLRYIHSRTRFGSRFGLERMQELLRRVGNPQEHLRFVHIAGTNGKGSTATYIANTLTAAGYRCGRYISPFVLNFNERISIDGVSISDEDLAWAVNILKPHVEQMDDTVTEFELVTAAAMLYYYAQGCDVVSLETGLGGRFDATNVIPAPMCAVLTKISFDHMQYLGTTLEQIAFEKCGIVKPGSAVISYPFQFSEAAGVIARTAEERGCPLYLPDNDKLEILRSDIDGSLIEYDGLRLRVPLAGRHQIYNAVTAVCALQYLTARRGFRISREHMAEGIGNTFFPARLEVLRREPTVLLDAAHNADGMRTLCDALDNFAKGKKIVAVFGVFKDKDYKTELEMLAKCADCFITLTPDDPRGLDGGYLAHLCRRTGKPAEHIPDYLDAYKKALELAGPKGFVVICGCLHMASDIRALLQNLSDESVG